LTIKISTVVDERNKPAKPKGLVILTFLLLSIFFLNMVSSATLEVAHYTFNETSGTTLIDIAGDNNGTNNGATVNVTGKIGKAYSFDGTNDAVYIDSTDFSGKGQITLSLWAKFDTLASDRALVSNWDTGVEQIMFFYDTPNVLRVMFNSEGDILRNVSATYTPPTDGTWIHIRAEYDGTNGTVKLFVNNSQVGTTTSFTAGEVLLIADNDLYIGASNDLSRDFDGKIDEIGIWNKVLTSNEKTELYNSGNGLQYPFNNKEFFTLSLGAEI
jgi:hypothetical protein